MRLGLALVLGLAVGACSRAATAPQAASADTTLAAAPTRAASTEPPMIGLELGKPVHVDGVKIAWVRGPDEGADGEERYDLEVDGHPVELAGQEQEAEVEADGKLVVLTVSFEYPTGAFTSLDLRPEVKVCPRAPPRLSEAEAVARVRAVLADNGVVTTDVTATTEEHHGMLEVRVGRGQRVFGEATIGLYTGNIGLIGSPSLPDTGPVHNDGPGPLGYLEERIVFHEAGTQTTQGGFTLTIDVQPSGPDGVRDYRFTVEKGGASEHVALRGQEIYAELSAFDHVFGIQGSRDYFVAGVHDEPSEPHEAEARRLAEAYLDSVGIAPQKSATRTEAGKLIYRATFDRHVLDVFVGLYTRMLLYVDYPDPRELKTPPSGRGAVPTVGPCNPQR